MVRSNNAKSPSKTVQNSSGNSNTQKNKSADYYEIDPELFNSEYNQTRKPSLPYGIVINDNPAGILLPNDQLVKAEWHVMPNVEELTTVELSEEVTGLLLQKARMLVLAFVPMFPGFVASQLSALVKKQAVDVVDASTGDAWIWAKMRRSSREKLPSSSDAQPRS
jgi:hypothetical protein